MGPRRLLATTALGLLLAGCGGGGAKATISSTTTNAPTSRALPAVPTTAVPATPATPAEGTTPTGPTTTTGSGGCTTAVLSVSLGRSDAGAGHVGTVVLFRNTGTGPCVLSGYPGVAALDAQGAQVAQARRTANGYLGGLQSGLTTGPTVTLTAGGEASALVEGTDVPSGSATSCPSYPAVLITPPGETHSVRLALAAPFPGCSDLLVHPVVPGTTGSN